MAKIPVFGQKNDESFKTKKLNKKVIKHSVDTPIQVAFANIWLFQSKIKITLVQKSWRQRLNFFRFLKNAVFSQKSGNLKTFL